MCSFCDNFIKSRHFVHLCTFCSVYITLQYKYLFKKVLQSWSVDKWKKSSFMQEQGDYFNNNVYSSGKHISEIKKNPCTGIVLEWVLFMEILLGSWANYVSHTGDLWFFKSLQELHLPCLLAKPVFIFKWMINGMINESNWNFLRKLPSLVSEEEQTLLCLAALVESISNAYKPCTEYLE